MLVRQVKPSVVEANRATTQTMANTLLADFANRVGATGIRVLLVVGNPEYVGDAPTNLGISVTLLSPENISIVQTYVRGKLLIDTLESVGIELKDYDREEGESLRLNYGDPIFDYLVQRLGKFGISAYSANGRERYTLQYFGVDGKASTSVDFGADVDNQPIAQSPAPTATPAPAQASQPAPTTRSRSRAK